MQFALTSTGRTTALPGIDGTCPGCKGRVIAKCGEVNAWHWAHEASECDPWYEPESQWHRQWKSIMKPECVEVVLGPHRADIRTSDGFVVELQHSSIDVDTIVSRERFYGKMRWIFDAQDWNLYLRDRGDYVTFRWKWPRKTLGFVTKPMLWDLGCGFLLHVKKLDVEPPSGGWGKLVHVSSLVDSPTARDLNKNLVWALQLYRNSDVMERMHMLARSSDAIGRIGIGAAIRQSANVWKLVERAQKCGTNTIPLAPTRNL